MRKLILLFCLSIPAFGALPATVVWDVQPSTGSDTNGGGCDTAVSGTCQPGAGIAFSDLVAATTTATSVTLAFVSANSSNFIDITGGSGCNTGRFEILSVTTGTATMNATMGTGTCTGRAYGSFATFAAAVAAASVSGQGITLKSTTTLTSTVTMSTASITITGYLTTPGDMGTCPLITTATNSTDLIDVAAGYIAFNNVCFSNTAGTRANGLVKTSATSFLTVQNSTMSGFTTAINGDNQGAHYQITLLSLFNDTFTGNTYPWVNEGNVIGKTIYIHGNTNGPYDGGTCLSGSTYCVWAFQGLVTYNNTNFGLKVGYNHLFADGLVAYGNGGDGVYVDSTGPFTCLTNFVGYGNGGYGFHTNGAVACNQANAYGSNALGPRSGLPVGIGDQTLTAAPFVSPVGNNFNPNTTAGGGALLTAMGWPGAAAFGTGTTNIGAVQASSAGSSIASGAYVQ